MVIDLMPKISETIPPAIDVRYKTIVKKRCEILPCKIKKNPRAIKTDDTQPIIVPASALPKPAILVLPTGICRLGASLAGVSVYES